MPVNTAVPCAVLTPCILVMNSFVQLFMYGSTGYTA